MRKILTTILFLCLSALLVQAQIKIGGSVYGGGNAGNLGGKTSVTIYAGDLNEVYGGARQANVGGSAFVNIDGEHISSAILINKVYGGNDISGTIGTSETMPITPQTESIDKTYNAFIKTTAERNEAGDGNKIFIGQLFGGGNGAYDYSEGGAYEGKSRPELGKTYLELLGGTFGYVFGGGNNATVTTATDICINNSSTPMESNGIISLPESINLTELGTELNKPANQRLMDMGINITTFQRGYNFLRVFGGNNLADMHIMPTWHLKKGSIINLYSGGNEGRMTSPSGLLLEIGELKSDGTLKEESEITVHNIYGGCRKADVLPLNEVGDTVTAQNPDGYNFPDGISARVLIRTGHITNVYGGNDISGTVYGGNAVGVYTSIDGDIYGGGNGSYAYTDNAAFKNDILWSDYYYDPGDNSIAALNAHRPNAEQVSIRVKGTENNPTIIRGSIYCGGNSATLKKGAASLLVELKIGSYMRADNVFLGNNGANMVDPADGGVLWQYKQQLYPQEGRSTGTTLVPFSTLDLTNAGTFAEYMKGCAMDMLPKVVFDGDGTHDSEVYQRFTSYIGSLFCGGNRGSMTYAGTNTLNFSKEIYIYNKVVGGCNNAKVDAVEGLNAAYEGGIIVPLSDDEKDVNTNKLVLNFNGTLLKPMRLNDAKTDLEWNVKKWQTSDDAAPVLVNATTNGTVDDELRLDGGNIYGGCYTSGIVNGNVEINILSDLIERDKVFGEGNSGVSQEQQSQDVMGKALNVFGAGYGTGSSIQGNTTINLKGGYAFHTFGGGEMGSVTGNATTNLNTTIVNRGAEADKIYGGGLEGSIGGNVYVHLGTGTADNVIGGSCNADITGHTEVYIGDIGNPTITHNVYGGNDLGGRIIGVADFSDKIDTDISSMVYHANNPKAAAYVEYTKGTVGYIFGGCYGDYDYRDRKFWSFTNADGSIKEGFKKPYLTNAFVNFKPVNYTESSVGRIYGAGKGHAYTVASDLERDKSQDRSYVLIDIPDGVNNFANTAVFGAGDYSGVGIGVDPETAKNNTDGITAAAVIDLMRGEIGAVYGASYQEGFTRRTIVNVPKDPTAGSTLASTIKAKKLFGGAYGSRNTVPCDVYEATVNYHSEAARLTDSYIDSKGKIRYSGAIYGGNNNARRTLYGRVNIDVPLILHIEEETTYLGTIYGAGYGENSWSQYTEVNLNRGARVYEVYGGGQNGKVINIASLVKWNVEEPTLYTAMPAGYSDNGLDNDLALTNRLATEVGSTKIPKLNTKHNTNVHINEGATVVNYAYGGGLGSSTIPNSGDVYGTAYIDVLGGTVLKDLYAAGTSGDIKNRYDADFTASANTYLRGGSVRNIYGGGWEGSVGKHEGALSDDATNDILGETNVIIGIQDGTKDFINGIPAVERNAYGGGEGGAVYGTTNLTFYDGYIGYRYHADRVDDPGTEKIDERYEEKIIDETTTMADPHDNKLLEESGNIFGGGYVDNSSVDSTYVTMYGGHVRGSMFGGGEIAAVGRGSVSLAGTDNVDRTLNDIYKPGRTNITMYGGHVLRNVFGGGRGYDNLNRVGKLYSDGFVFGQSNVNIRGGEIGSQDGLANSYGNVFGGGDVGYVYSGTGKKVGTKTSDENLVNGIPDNGGGFYYEGGNISNGMTRDCNVDVAAYCRAKEDVTIDGHTFAAGEYVPTEYLNKLQRRTSENANGRPVWDKLNVDGIKIHNAIFAGGNVSIGSDKMYANTTTVYGNVTAAIRDVYNRDLIEVGSDHIGGLYGDGNLTFADGFRDLHIDNYGTDYFGLNEEISLEEYRDQLTDRERAYFVLKYKCIKACTDRNGKTHSPSTSVNVNDALTSDEIRDLFAVTDADTNPNWTTEAWNATLNEPNSEYWQQNGFCSLYAGRLLNTVQRADMVAIFGSRMVMQGARDRVPEKVDYTNYTINRVDEVSLNKRESQAGDSGEDAVHGNYFGIYNIVNYLGNLTSDVYFDDPRTTNTSNQDNASNGQSYYQWKKDRHEMGNRNNATSHNKVALASGVYLEIIREESETAGETEWGYITGVVELDLIDVRQGFGGGYVYARNEHGTKTHHPDYDKVTLSPYNHEARTYRRFTYAKGDTNQEVIETSGNFVHYGKQIIDDCYPNANAYKGADASPAHYWYIKGSVYVYDQYISAYTGSPNAYAQTANIPLTISASSHGKLTLRDVQPNLYAYRGDDGLPLGSEGKVIINNVTYRAGDPIDYWTWNTLSDVDQSRFVKEVYLVVDTCKVNGVTYNGGSVMLPADAASLKSTNPAVTYVEGGVEKNDKDFDYFFRPANNLSHDTGYLLTSDFNNPGVWDDYYTLLNGGTPKSITKENYEALSASDKARYTDGPTYTAINSGVYGQRLYTQGEVLSSQVVNDYPASYASGRTDQAEVAPAYIVTSELKVTNIQGNEQHLFAGAPINRADYTEAVWSSMIGSVEPAKVCTSTLDLGNKEYVYANTMMSATDYNLLKSRLMTDQSWEDSQAENYLKQYITDAYICTKEGLYGGAHYEAGHSYRALNAWAAMSKEDRQNFRYNYDGLDLLIDPTYGGGYGNKYQYDGYKPGSAPTSTTPQYEGCSPLYPKVYSIPQSIDYEAEYTGNSALTWTDEEGVPQSISPGYGNRVKRQKYESIPNEKVHWSPITVTGPGNYYIVKEAFIRGDFPYTVGQVLSEEQYNSMSDKRDFIDVIPIDNSHVGTQGSDGKYAPVTYYFCRESYKIGEHGEGHGFRNLGITNPPKEYAVGDSVPRTVLINESSFNNLPNKQTNFIIHGAAPIETSTLYVSSESDILSLKREKIITVIYLYEYQESDESGHNITPVSERHILNIHIQFESGVPEIDELQKPSTVLPGTTIGLTLPRVSEGAWKITSSGWEIFTNESDAESHQNGQPYINSTTPLYWYQNGYWVAYYASTYLGKTYSNAVQLSVANYHDLADVMSEENKEHHMYIDHPDIDRASKIYINDYSADGTNGLDLFKDLINLSNGHGPAGHSPIGTAGSGLDVTGGKEMEFIMRTNIDYSTASGASTWEPIAGNSGECFNGVLHGDGHYIKGLKNSLFGNLCEGSVYNLGVMGSFTSGGIADTGEGYVANCWVQTTGTPLSGVKAVFGNPTGSGTQVFNCYYPDNNAYTSGNARKLPAKAFFNGEVAYDLNGYYLYKRYFDNNTSAVGTTPYTYKYYKDGTNAQGNAELQLTDGNYSNSFQDFVYVEDRYRDGDFVYANGTIPDNTDVRQHLNEETSKTEYSPIWPDDYIFFGQTLNYGHQDGVDHQAVPSPINKTDGRVVSSALGNRVYRAPAYFQNKDMQVTHFNPYAIFAKTKKDDASVTAYQGMTAIDFTGYNDVSNGYKEGVQTNGHFFPPLLDDNGLTGFRNVDLTRNLLVYTGTTAPASAATNTVVGNVLTEPDYAETDSKYRTVDMAETGGIKGHWVQQSGSLFTTTNDHLLVDRNDFNAPISYKMGNGKRMWYQRTPDRYVDLVKGWETVSLPFSAELVTTQDKGEITHFYSGSRTAETDGVKIGHEYWLREFTGKAQKNSSEPDVYVAAFNYPLASGNTKTATNTFLWDYYYSANTQQDANLDSYQTYYDSQREYAQYPLLANGTPYIVGFPGATYYEFDLSGTFIPQHTAPTTPAKLHQQVITFASEPAITILVSDDEIAAGAVTNEGYTFVPNYLNKEVAANEGYLMNNNGNAFDKKTAPTPLVPFRSFFIKVTPATPAPKDNMTRSIIFDNDDSQFAIGDERDPSQGNVGQGGLTFFTKHRRLGVTSSLRQEADVHIVNTSGQTVASFTIQPGETIETPVRSSGVYIIHAAGGHYQKKLAVK